MDDEETICTLVSCALGALGYEVVETLDALSAIQRYREEFEAGRPFHAVIMDLTIPAGMGGQEAVREVLAIDPGAKVIVSSGYAADPVMSEFSTYGFCACLSKPYEIAALGRVVREVVSSPKEELVFHDFAHPRSA